MMKTVKIISLLALACMAAGAEVVLPNIFSDYMLLQQQQKNPVWGMADPGERVTVEFAGQKKTAVADEEGRWKVELDPLEASFEGRSMKIYSFGKLQSEICNILVGEVWMCSGQSNMAWSMNAINDYDMEVATANYPNIRLLAVPRVGTQEPQFNIEAAWTECTPETVKNFSAPGFLFGRKLHHALKVPVGLIYNAWGGSDLEAWLPIHVLEEAGQDEYLAEWNTYLSRYSDEYLEKQKIEYKQWVADGKPGKKRFEPRDVRIGQKRPANIYNGVLHPTIGYGIKGVIWCQGESNIGRAYEYRSLFPLLITTWREWWDNDDLPFYWIQLADHNYEKPEPGESYWAELREAQTITLKLPHTGEAVVIDLGEARDIHYRDKQTAAARLVRHALGKDYGFNIATESPRFQSLEIKGDKAVVTFDHVATHLYAFDVPEVKGFAVAGADKKFYWAEAKIIGKNKVEVWSDQVPEPVAVRYGWADNPVVNLYDRNSLPVTPFRSDDWPVGTMGKKTLYRLMPE
ncbi:sialate O-acetylesterase [Pontiella agarivorans]|uniref:Sialate O-acetylesterase n=1 Tax=Pontiella agarivorans TaxID=3038953 RepID=A0ABU5MUA3_9BACT|nr:sialate O-acetylesterase [Pontiella agarivorans]MDZ8117551.1 sialate O-acetylesterase [Pontiella agarivorans]